MLKKIICFIIISLTTLCFISFSNYGLEIVTVSELQHDYAKFGIDGGYYYFENDGKIMHITND